VLGKVAIFIKSKIDAHQPVRLVFICTHNSRRSHISQIWAQIAAHFYEVPEVRTYSGGTEATAFNPNAVEAMREAGLKIHVAKGGQNPVYEVHYAKDAPVMRVFSKVFDEGNNPQMDFAAIMTCSHADENCPFIPGASLRIPVTYEDPKVFDGAPQQEQAYKERNQQIAREMFYLFSKV
jgi:arsenate reductase (thioredoxin)